MKRTIAAVAVSVGLVFGGGSVAEAAITQVPSEPIKVTVNAPDVWYRTTLRTNTTLEGVHYASIWLMAPATGVMMISGQGRTESPDVKVAAQLYAVDVSPSWGLVDGVAVDDIDGRSRAITLDVRRASKVGLKAVDRGPLAVLNVTVRHYSGDEAAKWIPSQKSPVRVQERVQGEWVAVKSSVTDRDGKATVLVRKSPGRHIYRVIRPNGATVWGATSPTRSVG